jgi:hypothetical protein
MGLTIKIDTLEGDRKVATLNGKSYTLLRGYRNGRWGQSDTLRFGRGPRVTHYGSEPLD